MLLIHLSPQLQALICPLGFPHFYPFCWDGPFSAVLWLFPVSPQHLLGQLGSEGAGTRLGVKPALCLPPPKPLPLSGGAGTVLGSTAQRVLPQENKEQSLQRPVLPVAD